jgi:hypothetical protein
MDWGGSNSQAASTISIGFQSIAAFYVFAPSAVRESFVDPTIMRMLINFNASTPFVTAAGMIGVGIIAWDDVNDVPDDVPSPIQDQNLDWMWTTYVCRSSEAASINDGSRGNDNITGMYDVSSKRRMGNTKGLLMVVHNYTQQQVQFTYAMRFLLKE